MKTAHANRGRALETAVLVSQGNLVTLFKIPNGMRFIGKGQTVTEKTPFDYAGVVNATRRAICFDAKMCELVRGFPLSNTSAVKPHQIWELSRMGRAGALSGLLVESEANGRYQWLDWSHFGKVNSVPWIDSMWIDMGPTTHAIQWGNLLAPVAVGAGVGTTGGRK